MSSRIAPQPNAHVQPETRETISAAGAVHVRTSQQLTTSDEFGSSLRTQTERPTHATGCLHPALPRARIHRALRAPAGRPAEACTPKPSNRREPELAARIQDPAIKQKFIELLAASPDGQLHNSALADLTEMAQQRGLSTIEKRDLVMLWKMGGPTEMVNQGGSVFSERGRVDLESFWRRGTPVPREAEEACRERRLT